AALERRVVAREVLQQGGKGIRPRVLPLVDAEHVVAVGEQPQPEVGADLARRAGDQDAHASSVTSECDGSVATPRSVVEVASSMRTSTSSPGLASPLKLTVVLRRVRPRRSDGSVRDLVGHRGRLRTRPWGVDERERAVVADLPNDLERLFEVDLRLARKTDDDVGADREV